MQRPPLACSKAVQSLKPPPQPHIWISDDLLSQTLHRFFRAGCTHQKRHGSHTPGPLEARRRAVKRKLSVHASFPQEGFAAPLFNFKSLFAGRRSQNASWRYEAPSLSTGPVSHKTPFDTGNILDIPPESPFPIPVPAQNHDRKASAREGTALGCEDRCKDPPEGGEAPAPLDNALGLKIKIRALEHRLRESTDVEGFLACFDDWLRLVNELPNSEQRTALDRCCRKGYAVGDRGPLLTLRIFERLTHNNWNPRTIARWLSRPAVPLPSLGSRQGRQFLEHLRVQFERLSQPHDDAGAAGGHPFATLYEKLAAPLLSTDSLLDRETAPLLYWARWKTLLLNHPISMKGSPFQSLEWIANVVSEANADDNQSLAVPKRVLDRLWPLVESDCLDETSLRQQRNVLPTRAAGLDNSQSKVISTGVESLYAEHDDRVHRSNVQFQKILDRARSAGVLPPAYWNETVDAPSYRRLEIIHELAHCYSVNHTLRLASKWHALRRLHNYLVSYDLPIQPLFTKASVRICLGEAMMRGTFVTSFTMDWLLELVVQVEGPEVARSLEHQFWVWRGGLIGKAKQVAKVSQGPQWTPTKARVNTLRRLGLLL